jgi:ribonuclease Z
MKRALLGLLALILLVVAIGWAFRMTLTKRSLPKFVEAAQRTNLLLELPDGLHVALCGAGSPLPDPNRSGPCTAVIAGEQLFIVDTGSASTRNLGRLRIPVGEIDGILLTHFHSDHIDGLGELLLQRWVNGGHTSPTPVYGPDGVEQVVSGFNLAYLQDQRYRVAHHGGEIVPPSGAGAAALRFATPRAGEGVVVLEKDGLRITAFQVAHPPIEPAVGYRFDYAGRSVLLSGDTNKSANLREFASGVDLLVHEALAPQLVVLITEGLAAAGRDDIAQITTDILSYHATPVEAAAVARDSGADFLLYYHVVPPLLLGPMEDIFLEGVRDVYDGPVAVGRDGTLVSLPANSDAIEIEELF